MDDRAFAGYLLAKEDAPEPEPRMAVYRNLVRTGMSSAIEGVFSKTESILGEDGFADLIARFLESGGPTTSLYRDVPGDFVRWAEESQHPLADLIQWEWLDLVAQRHPADLDHHPRSHGAVVPNPTLQVGVYGRPVEKMGAEHPSPASFDSPIAYLVWRRPLTDETAFHRAGLLLVRGLGYASQEPMTPAAIAQRLAADAPDLDPREIEAGFARLCDALRARDGLL
jgi:hypothetical protein